MDEQDRYRREIYAEYKLGLGWLRVIWRVHRAFLAPMEAKRQLYQQK